LPRSARETEGKRPGDRFAVAEASGKTFDYRTVTISSTLFHQVHV